MTSILTDSLYAIFQSIKTISISNSYINDRNVLNFLNGIEKKIKTIIKKKE
jgi:hypothetical protein